MRNSDRSSIGRATRVSIVTNVHAPSAAPASSAITSGLDQPRAGASITPNVNSVSAVVNAAVPGQSSPVACGSRDSCMRGSPNASDSTPATALVTKIARQP